MFDQRQYYFTVNKLTTDFQHAYRDGHSTSTALTQITDWLREIDDEKIGGAVLLDFDNVKSRIDQSLLLAKLMCYGFTPPAILWIKSYLSNITQMVLFYWKPPRNPGRISNYF